MIVAALCGSRKRARCVIQTDLPFLFAKEFSSTMSDDASTLVSKVPKNNVADLHQTRWSSLFTQMEMALSEEEKQLVSLQFLNICITWFLLMKRIMNVRTLEMESMITRYCLVNYRKDGLAKLKKCSYIAKEDCGMCHKYKCQEPEWILLGNLVSNSQI